MTALPCSLKPEGIACPLPKRDYDRISIAHGGGGRLTRELFHRVFCSVWDSPVLAEETDGANLDLADSRVTLTTDSFVVRPIFFPGGDIGKLAVHGSVNDLAVCGARPVALATAFVLEEGLPVDDLERVVLSMGEATREVCSGFKVVCGDTKVVEHAVDVTPGMIVTTTALGIREVEPPPHPSRILPGDAILVSGPIGDHGMAVMSVREGLQFEASITSDTQSLWSAIASLMKVVDVHCMRDATRGGISSALNELAAVSKQRFTIEEARVPVWPEVAAACEILGFDPMYVACEGRFVAFVDGKDADLALETLKAHPSSTESAIIGRVEKADRGEVTVLTPYGAERPLDMLSGEQLPRIC